MRRVLALAWVSAALLLAACGGGEARPTPTPLPGTVLEPPKPIGDFTLTAHTGTPWRLSDQRGTVLVIYFGYTSCPDICPTTLSYYRQAKALLGQDAARVRFVMIGVDPPRDTPERLAAYMTAFDPDFIGLSGEEATLRPIARDFGVFYQRVDYSSETNYLVDHTASTFMINAQGDLRVVLPYGTAPADLAARVRAVLKEK